MWWVGLSWTMHSMQCVVNKKKGWNVFQLLNHLSVHNNPQLLCACIHLIVACDERYHQIPDSKSVSGFSGKNTRRSKLSEQDIGRLRDRKREAKMTQKEDESGEKKQSQIRDDRRAEWEGEKPKRKEMEWKNNDQRWLQEEKKVDGCVRGGRGKWGSVFLRLHFKLFYFSERHKHLLPWHFVPLRRLRLIPLRLLMMMTHQVCICVCSCLYLWCTRNLQYMIITGKTSMNHRISSWFPALLM